MGANIYSEAELNNIIGQNVRYYRQLYNLGKPSKSRITQEKLAELAEVSTSLIGNLESERVCQGISIYTLWKISRAIDTSIEKFFVPLPES